MISILWLKSIVFSPKNSLVNTHKLIKNKTTIFVTMLLMTFSAIGNSTSQSIFWISTAKPHLIVRADAQSFARDIAKISYGNIFYIEDQKVNAEGGDPEYMKIRMLDGTIGYVSRRYIEPLQ